MRSPRRSPRRVATMLNRYPDRFLFGTDTVAPRVRCRTSRSSTSWAPVWRLLTPEASLRLRKSNYERISTKEGAESAPGKKRHQVTAFIRFHKQETRHATYTDEPESRLAFS